MIEFTSMWQNVCLFFGSFALVVVSIIIQGSDMTRRIRGLRMTSMILGGIGLFLFVGMISSTITIAPNSRTNKNLFEHGRRADSDARYGALIWPSWDTTRYKRYSISTSCSTSLPSGGEVRLHYSLHVQPGVHLDEVKKSLSSGQCASILRHILDNDSMPDERAQRILIPHEGIGLRNISLTDLRYEERTYGPPSP